MKFLAQLVAFGKCLINIKYFYYSYYCCGVEMGSGMLSFSIFYSLDLKYESDSKPGHHQYFKNPQIFFIRQTKIHGVFIWGGGDLPSWLMYFFFPVDSLGNVIMYVKM